MNLTLDEVYPRDEEHRYRLYARTGRRDLTVLAAASSPAAIGVAIATLHEDQRSVGRRLADLGQIGILDVLAGPKGDWILLPFGRDEA